MKGTGFAGSETNASNPADPPPSRSLSTGFPASRVPLASRKKSRGLADLGGQASYFRQMLVPVSNTHAFGNSPSPFPFRWNSKNGSSIFSRKYSPVLLLKGT